MNLPRKRSALLSVFLLLLIGLAGGCRSVGPTKASTYWAVRDYFGLKTRPYAILFGTEELRGPAEVWPIEIYPLYYRDEFQRAYPGKYLIFRNEYQEWKVLEENELKEMQTRREKEKKP